jgi:SAM-dependent methyltransferase
VEPLSVNLLESWPHQYDVVLSMDVLYHRDVDPVEALRGMRRLLNPGGLLLVNVAAMPCLRRGHDERVMGARRFLPRDLRRLVQQSGVAVESIRYWNGWLTPLLWLQLQLEMLRSPGRSEPAEKKPNESEIRLPPPWLNRMLEALLQAEFLCSEVLPLPFGSSLFMKGRREDNGVEP